MTSSLVGSEMCIRDRACPPVEPAACSRRCAARGERSCQSPKPAVSGTLICLLYTSDAADDM
eukprot:6930621-Prorocentrum_lima.AAC.1